MAALPRDNTRCTTATDMVVFLSSTVTATRADIHVPVVSYSNSSKSSLNEIRKMTHNKKLVHFVIYYVVRIVY